MGYDHGESFPFGFNQIETSIGLNSKPIDLNQMELLGSKSQGKLSSRSYPIQFERKW